MKSYKLFLAAVCGGLVVLLGSYFLPLHTPSTQPVAAPQTAFERVMQTRTLRCGYIIAAPGLVKDANTGQLSGLVYDLVTELGKTLDLKIDWAEETTHVTEVQDLKTGRYDMICSTLYLRPNLMPYAEFTQPYLYLPINVIQRKGEGRFKTVADIDKSAIKIGAVDGTMPSLIAQDDFKKATLYSLPQMTAYAENILALISGKADVTFVDPLIFDSVAKNNPDQLEINASIPPLRVFANVFAVMKGEHDLATMISAATQHLLNNGKVEEIIKKYEPLPGAVLRVTQPYTKQP
jgi:ABC-type amino acid transport substrate-binding protein